MHPLFCLPATAMAMQQLCISCRGYPLCRRREAGVAHLLPWPTEPADVPKSYESDPGASWTWPEGDGAPLHCMAKCF